MGNVMSEHDEYFHETDNFLIITEHGKIWHIFMNRQIPDYFHLFGFLKFWHHGKCPDNLTGVFPCSFPQSEYFQIKTFGPCWRCIYAYFGKSTFWSSWFLWHLSLQYFACLRSGGVVCVAIYRKAEAMGKFSLQWATSGIFSMRCTTSEYSYRGSFLQYGLESGNSKKNIVRGCCWLLSKYLAKGLSLSSQSIWSHNEFVKSPNNTFIQDSTWIWRQSHLLLFLLLMQLISWVDI